MKTLFVLIAIFVCVNISTSQSFLIMNASHSYDIIDIKFATYGIDDQLNPALKLNLNLPVPSRAGLKVNSLPSGTYYILYKLSNNLSYEVRKFKYNKSVTIWLGKGIESSDYER